MGNNPPAGCGIEFGLFNNSLTGEFDYYIKKTKDLLYSRPVTAISGIAVTLSNTGEMENKGVELVLNSTNVSGTDFRWTTSLNISRNKNKVLKLDGEQTVICGDSRFAKSIVAGQPIGIFYGVKYAGVDLARSNRWYLDYLLASKLNNYEKIILIYNNRGTVCPGLLR